MSNMGVFVFLVLVSLLLNNTMGAQEINDNSKKSKKGDTMPAKIDKLSANIDALNDKIGGLRNTCASDNLSQMIQKLTAKVDGLGDTCANKVSVKDAAKVALLAKLRENATKEQLIKAATTTVVTEEQMEQWVQSVTQYSSQYTTSSWSANQVLGAPDMYPKYGDSILAWCALAQRPNEYLELQFGTAVYVTGVAVYETLGAGSVTAIKARGEGSNLWVTLWQTSTPQNIASARIFQPTLTSFNTPTRNIRIEFDYTGGGPHWVEIDAVKLIGKISSSSVGQEGTLIKKLKDMATQEELLQAAVCGQ